MSGWDAIVLAGGTGHRLGGVDKPALVVGRRTLLDVALVACAEAEHTVVVGPQRNTARPVTWTREEPIGSGPLAALAAGLRAIPSGVDTVIVLASDLPAITPAVVRVLVAGVAGAGAVAADNNGRIQPLLAAYRRATVERVLADIGDPTDQPMRRLTDALVLAEIHIAEAAADIDTPDDLARWQEG